MCHHGDLKNVGQPGFRNREGHNKRIPWPGPARKSRVGVWGWPPWLNPECIVWKQTWKRLNICNILNTITSDAITHRAKQQQSMLSDKDCQVKDRFGKRSGLCPKEREQEDTEFPRAMENKQPTSSISTCLPNIAPTQYLLQEICGRATSTGALECLHCTPGSALQS